MKRTPSTISIGIRAASPFENLSKDQLAHIGAIALLFNDLEECIDKMCSQCLADSIETREITSRINGLEGKVEIVKHAARQWECTATELGALGETLGENGFLGAKGLRDAVVHARMSEISTSVAHTRGKRGKVSEVWLHIDALKALFGRMEHLLIELYAIKRALERQKQIHRGYLDDHYRAQLEEEIRGAWLRAQQHRSHRQSFLPIPEWPEKGIPPEPGPSARGR